MSTRLLPFVLVLVACGEPRRATPAASATPTTPVAIPCGPAKSCDARHEYCETIQTDVPALPSTYTCKTLPATCSPSEKRATCDCFPHPTRCGFCRELGTSAPTLTGFNRVCVGGA